MRLYKNIYDNLERYYFSSVLSSDIEKIRIIVCLAIWLQYLTFFSNLSFFLSFEGVFPYSVNVILLCLLIVVCFAALVGFKTKISLYLLFFLHFYFYYNSEYPYWGGGWFSIWLLLALCMSNAAAEYSIDCRYLDKCLPRESSIYPFRWVQLQLAVSYWVINLIRIDDLDWQHGTVVQSFLESKLFSRISFLDFSYISNGLSVLTHLSLVFELIASFSIFSNLFSHRLVFAFIFFHLTLGVLGVVGYWPYFIISAWLILLFKTETGSGRERSLFKNVYLRMGVIVLTVLLSLSFYFSAIPTKYLGGVFLFARNKAREKIIELKIGRVLNSGMMLESPPYGVCIFVDEIANPSSAEVYSSDLESCIGDKTNFTEDLIGQSVFRRLNFKNKNISTDEIARTTLNQGNAFCNIEGRKNTLEKVLVTAAIIDSKESDKVTLRTIASFDCKSKTTVTIANPDKRNDQIRQSINSFLSLKTNQRPR